MSSERGVGGHGVAQGLLAAEDVERVGLADHRPVDEERVDPARMLQRLAQARRRLEVQRQGDGPELQVQIDQGHSASAPVRDGPGDTGRKHRGADAATRAADGDQPAPPIALLTLGGALDDIQQRLLYQSRRDRLDQIVADAVVDQVAEQSDVIAVTDGDHGHAGLAHLGQLVDGR